MSADIRTRNVTRTGSVDKIRNSAAFSDLGPPSERLWRCATPSETLNFITERSWHRSAGLPDLLDQESTDEDLRLLHHFDL